MQVNISMPEQDLINFKEFCKEREMTLSALLRLSARNFIKKEVLNNEQN